MTKILNVTLLFFRRIDNFSKEEDVVIFLVSDKDHAWTVKTQRQHWVVGQWAELNSSHCCGGGSFLIYIQSGLMQSLKVNQSDSS